MSAQSLEEIEARRSKFVLDLKNIDTQLAQTRRNHSDGRQMTREEYSQWRNKAVVARNYIERGLIAANKDLRAARAALKKEQANITADGPDGLLLAAHTLLRRLVSEDVDLDPPEFAVLDAIRDHLQSQGLLP